MRSDGKTQDDMGRETNFMGTGREGVSSKGSERRWETSRKRHVGFH